MFSNARILLHRNQVFISTVSIFMRLENSLAFGINFEYAVVARMEFLLQVTSGRTLPMT